MCQHFPFSRRPLLVQKIYVFCAENWCSLWILFQIFAVLLEFLSKFYFGWKKSFLRFIVIQREHRFEKIILFNFFTFLFPLPVPSKKMVVICARAKYKFDQSGVSGKSTLLRALERRPRKKYYSQVLWFSLTQEQEPKGLFMQ